MAGRTSATTRCGTKRSGWRGWQPISGFDALWSAEHHFFDYSFCPDNLQLMTYLAALCPNVGLGTAAVIVPWHDPLRVAEQAAVLDLLCQGRLRLGLGRGLARREFAAFRGTMDESRERFDEAAPMIVEALRTGFIEGDGKHYKQPRIEIRPRPEIRFRRPHLCRGVERGFGRGRGPARRAYGDVLRPAVAPAAAGDRAQSRAAPEIPRPPGADDDDHRFLHLRPRPRPRPRTHARQYMGKFVESNFHHYELLGEHFATVKGYDAYAQKAEIARKGGLEGAVAGFMQAAVWGTPDRILRELEARRAVLGEFELNASFRFGGVPYEIAERGLNLFAKEVLPVLKSWRAEDSALAAE